MEPRETPLNPNEVHVWWLELEAGAETVERLARVLSVDEKERAARFRFERLRVAYTLSRGVLRLLLGRYLGVDPAQMRFAYGTRGKPRVAFPETAIEFNLAHSGRLAVYAFTIGRELGVDVEQIRPVSDGEGIVRQCFSPKECDEWLGLSRTLRDGAFFRCWTRKEAYIKALGDGLSLPLDSFQVSLRPDEPARLIQADGDATASVRWSMVDLAPGDGYAAALLMPAGAGSVRVMPRMTPAQVLDAGPIAPCR